MNTMISDAGRLIQLALAPIFLLTAASALLGVYSTRLGRVSDRIHAMKAGTGVHRHEIDRLHFRSRILDAAVVCAVLAGTLTCAAAMLLFVEGMEGSARKALIFSVFAGALFFAILSLLAYGAEIVIAGSSLREEN